MGFSWGPIALHGFVHLLSTTGPSLTKVVYAHFDRISYILCIYIYVYGCMYHIISYHMILYYNKIYIYINYIRYTHHIISNDIINYILYDITLSQIDYILHIISK
jgi:hypothetical protein